MDITIAEMDRLIDEVKARGEEPGYYYFPISPSMYRFVQMLAQGKRFYRGKPHKRKSPMRQPRAIRSRRRRDEFIRGNYWYKIEAVDHNGVTMKEIGTVHSVKFFEREAQ